MRTVFLISVLFSASMSFAGRGVGKSADPNILEVELSGGTWVSSSSRGQPDVLDLKDKSGNVRFKFRHEIGEKKCKLAYLNSAGQQMAYTEMGTYRVDLDVSAPSIEALAECDKWRQRFVQVSATNLMKVKIDKKSRAIILPQIDIWSSDDGGYVPPAARPASPGQA